MDILYCAQWKRAKRGRCREDAPIARPVGAILRIAVAVGLIFGGAVALDHAAVPSPLHNPQIEPVQNTTEFAMKFVCLVYGAESILHAMTPASLAELDASSLAHDRSLSQEGRLVIAQALQSVRTSKTVRRRGGKTLVTDGPFAETKEQLLGFVMIEANSLEEALDVAGAVPLAGIGSIEVRAIYDVPGS